MLATFICFNVRTLTESVLGATDETKSTLSLQEAAGQLVLVVISASLSPEKYCTHIRCSKFLRINKAFNPSNINSTFINYFSAVDRG